MIGTLATRLFHAVALVDHHSAKLLQFDAEQTQEHTLHEHQQLTRRHASGVRSEHEFFGAVCDALEGVNQVLVTGGHQALADFRHFADKHRPLTAQHIVGYEVVDHPSENELVAIARKFFVQYKLMQGITLPT